MSRRADGHQRARGAVFAGALAGVALVLWWAWPRAAPSEHEPPDVADLVDAPAPRAALARAPSGPPRAAPAAPPPDAHGEVADDGLGFMPPGPNAPRPDGPLHPHPITDRHRRIFAENLLVGALDGAMDVADLPNLRRLLAQYRREFPEDNHRLAAGYEIIADCLEHPTPSSRLAAEQWAETHRGSTLRRFVTRHCL